LILQIFNEARVLEHLGTGVCWCDMKDERKSAGFGLATRVYFASYPLFFSAVDFSHPDTTLIF